MSSMAHQKCLSRTALYHCRNDTSARCRRSMCTRANGSDVGVPTSTPASEAVEVVTVEDAQNAMQIGLGSAAQLTVSLTLTQIVLGFGLSPFIVKTLKEFPAIGQGLGPVASQALLIVVAGWLIDRNLKANNTDETKFFRYIAKPDQFLLVGAVTLGTLVGGVFLDQFTTPSMPQSNAADVASAIDLFEPFTMLGTGLATSLLSPWIEERIYRGVVLQGLMPYVGAPVAVVISAAIYAGSHLTQSGFPNLFLFGLALGTAHVVSGKNLLVPTAAHSAYNMFVFLAVVATVSKSL
eukprot:jgi/Ulvmu1/11724/UM008_0137.1